MLHDHLNAQCQCTPTGPGLALTAPQGVFLPRRTQAGLVEATRAVGRTLRRLRPRSSAVDNAGLFNSFDYHITPDGPKLIEINVNAGGLFLQPAIAASVASAPAGCLTRIGATHPADPVETILKAWSRHAGSTPLRRVAILDEDPETQPLHCEMQAARHALGRAGIACDILDIGQLAFDGCGLRGPSGPVDMVYNRWTDFTWATPQSRTLRHAHETGAAFVAPNPQVWQAYADKALLVQLAADPDRPAAILDAEAVTHARADALWTGRKSLVFKPLRGFASRGVYRGDKLSRRKWQDILDGGYLAQALAPPGQRILTTAAGARAFKTDIRVWTHGDTPLYMAARLFSGQVTGLSGEAEGFAPILWVEDEKGGPDACHC
ncbi:hypothetical protein [Maricaulis sp.]|uniref:hypothetical protein n=1 Tax=Maricaulis sp. TaxID=1486257 RepID=UPI00261E7939|nr:hypothetical protein [Maricaulis sp.]